MTAKNKSNREPGLSRRAYAKRRGVSETAVRQAIADGRLKGALKADGSIDADKADALLADGTTAGSKTPAALADARRRKLAAAVALLEDDVHEIRLRCATKEAWIASIRDSFTIAARHAWRIIELAPTVHGLGRIDAVTKLDEAIGQILDENHAAHKPTGEQHDTAACGRALADLSAVELAARRAELGAQKLELQRALKTGELIDLDKQRSPTKNRIIRWRTRLSQAAVKSGNVMGETYHATALAEFLEDEVKQALAELECEEMPLADLLAQRGLEPAKAMRLP